MSNKNATNGNNSSRTDSEVSSLKEKIAILEGIQSAMPDPYYVRDMDYNIIVWPEAIARLTGYSEPEAKRLKCYQMFKACVCPPGSACPTQNCIKVKQFLRDVAVDVYHKSGKTVHTLVSNAGIYNERGEPIGAVEIVKDNNVLQNSLESIGFLIKEIEAAAEELAAISNQIRTASEQVNNTAQDAMNSTKNGVQASYEVSQKVEHSMQYADEAQGKMQKISDSMKDFSDKISELKIKSESITKSASIIQSIAAKTDLLAINAAIQAVHAGNYGKGFKVVAEGIKDLSQNSDKAAQVISDAIRAIAELVKETADALSATDSDIKIGNKNIVELLGFVGDIDLAMRGLSSTMNSIENGAALTHKLGSDQSMVAVEVSKAARNVGETAGKLNLEFDRVLKVIKHQDMG